MESREPAPGEPAASEPAPGSYWQNNLALLVGALSLAFIAVRLLTVTGYDPETAYYVLQATGTGAVVAGTLVSTVGLAAAALAGFVLLYHYCVKSRIDPSGSGASFAVIGAVALIVIALITAPIVPLLALIVLTSVACLLTLKKGTGSRSRMNIILLYILTVIIVGSLITGIWIPAQRISAQGKPAFTGYILSEANGKLTVLTFNPVVITQISSLKVATEECRPYGYWHEQETLGELINTFFDLSERVSYRSCPARNRP
jgi:hypothetical protein